MSFSGFGGGSGIGAIGDIFGGLFGNSGAGYEEAEEQMRRFLQQANKGYKPFLDAGTGAIPQFQDWNKQFQDPNKFLQDIFSKYQMSPGAITSMNEAQRAATNAASASGLSGSTAHIREAGNIAQQASSKDMQQFLQNILGISNNYGKNLNTLMNNGLNAASGTANNFLNGGTTISNFAGNRAASEQGDINKLMSGIIQLLPLLFL